MAHDVFISHSTEDRAVADALCKHLEARGIRCWIAPRDIKGGASYPASIVAAIKSCRTLVLVYSSAADKSRQVKREVELADKQEKTILPFPIDATEPNEDLQFFLSMIHWPPIAREPFDAHFDSVIQALGFSGSGDATKRGDSAPTTLSRVSSPTNSTLASTKGAVETILIPAGDFLMGSDSYNDEKPLRRVFLDAYRIGRMPVTVAQFKAYCADAKIDFSQFPTPPWGWKDDHPIVNVSWQQARDFCNWAGGDLPTEAQWEKAARGADGRKYPWGNEWDTNALCCSDKEWGDAMSTAQVGSFPSGASPYGCLDMAGNVWEWCSDWYADGYRDQSDRNPSGPATGQRRVFRGGSWYRNDPQFFRSSTRNSEDPPDQAGFIGFRLAGPP